MNDRTYPDDVDCVWLASDRRSYLGAFATGGVGPIPLQALNCELVTLEEIEELIYGLPKVSDARLLVSMKRPDDFISMAERGFFVYDWRDIHRTAQEATQTYEPIAVPHNPLRIDALPKRLANVVEKIRFDNAVFIDGLALDVQSQMECRRGAQRV